MTKADKKEVKEIRRVEDEYFGRLYYDRELEEDGFEYRIVNDTPGNIRRLQRLGYEVVDQKIKTGMGHVNEASSSGSAVEFEVGIHLGSRKAVLMRIRKEDADARRELKKRRNDEQQGLIGETGIPTQYGNVTLGNK